MPEEDKKGVEPKLLSLEPPVVFRITKYLNPFDNVTLAERRKLKSDTSSALFLALPSYVIRKTLSPIRCSEKPLWLNRGLFCGELEHPDNKMAARVRREVIFI